MTDEYRDPKVSLRYRELGAEEPPRALDDAILAAARREAGARPVPAARGGRQRWYAPLAAAAVLVLAVAVTLNMQLEQPDIAEPKPPAAASVPAPAAPTPEAQLKFKTEERRNAAAREAGEEVKTARRKIVEPPAKSEAQAFPADQASAATRGAVPGVAGTMARQAEERTSRDAEMASRGPQESPRQALAKRAEEGARSQGQERQAPMVQAIPPPVAAKPAPAPAAVPRAAMRPALLGERLVDLTPEQELERIADLRRQGRHDEADKALAEFRKRHPDYRIPQAMRERVERR